MKKMLFIFTSAVALFLSGCAYSSDEKPNLSIQDSAPLTQSSESESETPSTIDSPLESTIFETIVNSSDLPQYYGSLKEAKKFSKQFEKNVVSTEDYDFKSDITILSIDGYWRDDKINGIEFYFKNADSSPSFEEAQKVMNMFLPFDIIDKYYDEPKQEMYTPNNANESSFITTCYSLNDSGRGQDGLQGQIGLVYEMKNDICLHANIRFGLPIRLLSESNGYFITKFPSTELTDNAESK